MRHKWLWMGHKWQDKNYRSKKLQKNAKKDKTTAKKSKNENLKDVWDAPPSCWVFISGLLYEIINFKCFFTPADETCLSDDRGEIIFGKCGAGAKSRLARSSSSVVA